ncbi:hypothetical protein V8E53_004356 [Lactarius tabidus]
MTPLSTLVQSINRCLFVKVLGIACPSLTSALSSYCCSICWMLCESCCIPNCALPFDCSCSGGPNISCRAPCPSTG